MAGNLKTLNSVEDRLHRARCAAEHSRSAYAEKNGLLTVTLPKTSTSKGTTIPIKAE